MPGTTSKINKSNWKPLSPIFCVAQEVQQKILIEVRFSIELSSVYNFHFTFYFRIFLYQFFTAQIMTFLYSTNSRQIVEINSTSIEGKSEGMKFEYNLISFRNSISETIHFDEVWVSLRNARKHFTCTRI